MSAEHDAAVRSLEVAAASPNEASAATRRSLLAVGKRLAYAAPAVVAALYPSAAAADGIRVNVGGDGSIDVRVGGIEVSLPGHRTAISGPFLRDLLAATADLKRRRLRVAFRAELAPIGRIEDVPANLGGVSNDGNDPLTSGLLHVVDIADRTESIVHVQLRGAARQATYQVIFLRLNDLGSGGVVDLDRITTDEDGDFRGVAPRRLGRSPDKLGRAGIFLLRRDVPNVGLRNQFIGAVTI
ncbi:MAG: hypothetical protein C4289_09025 [Chloroflexota bacterium]